MKSVDRLVKIASYYNKIKDREFYRDYVNPRIKDARAMVYNILREDFNYSLKDLCNRFNKYKEYIDEMSNHHDSEYKIIHHYTKLYDNVKIQFINWDNSELDLQYSIVKTKYDSDFSIRYENILNENTFLNDENKKLKKKLKEYKLCIN